MSSFLISTTGTAVSVLDLGLILSHPTVDRDLSLEFSAEEIANSKDLTSKIQAGDLVLKITTPDYALSEVDGYYYNPYLLLEQNFTWKELEEQFVISSELESSNKNKVIFEGVFPVAVSSTTAVTNVIVCNGASFETWRAYPGDIVVISGGTAAGTYTIASVQSQKIITTVESLPASFSEGTLTIYNPTGARLVGFDPTGLYSITSNNVQDAITELDTALSNITAATTGDSLIYNLSEDSYEEIIYNDRNVVNYIIWDSPLKSIKIREFQYSYNLSKIDQEIAIQYDGYGTEIEKLVKNYFYSDGKIVYINVDKI